MIRVTVDDQGRRLGSVFLDDGKPFVYSQHRASLLLALAAVHAALLAEPEPEPATDGD